MMASSDMISPALAAHLARAVPFPPQVAAAHFAEDASLYGAVALALDHLEGSDRRTYRPAGKLRPFRAAEAQAPGSLNGCRCAGASASVRLS